MRAITRWPTDTPWTSAATSVTTPATSTPGTNGSRGRC
jgi:hypothetical protein